MPRLPFAVVVTTLSVIFIDERWKMDIAVRHNPFPVNEKFRGIYSHGVAVDAQARVLYVSGQIGVAPDGGLDESFRGQCAQAFQNLEAVLKSAGMDFSNLVKMTFYLTRPQDLDALVDVRRQYVEGVSPAITTIFVAGLVDPNWLVEVEAVAADAPSA
ncbi:MAG: RidA family protein [Pseudomonadota bacterium]